jgi:hypothetical protein
VSPAHAGETWDYKKEFLPFLTEPVDELLKKQNKETGAWGEAPWICTDQNLVFPLAAAWSIKDPSNSWYHNEELLNAIMLGGDKLIAEAKPSGKWIFRKKDNSTWGDIFMPWTYSRWMRAYSMIKDAMPADRREKWEKALRHGFEGIAREEMAKRLANIPCHHAMGLYLAGKEFNHPEWCDAAKAYEHRVVDNQNPNGFWSEHAGPVIIYNMVYMDALGTYYAMSKDEAVAPALQRAAKFHVVMTYPNGTPVETVDERNNYENSVITPNVGFTFSPEGRGYLKKQIELRKARTKQLVGADMAASLILYGGEGEVVMPPAPEKTPVQMTSDRNALTRRQGPWFACMSAYHTPVYPSRWIQDRQNLVSLYHDKVGVILGGGNTKLQPLWSTFSVGDTSKLYHKKGDEDPNFLPPTYFYHVPQDAAIDPDSTRLLLQYGPVKCQVKVDLRDPKRAKLIYSSEGLDEKKVEGSETTFKGPVEAHIPFLVKIGGEWSTQSGKSGKIGAQPVKLNAGEAGDWFEHRNWKVYLPKNATVQWPVLPHNQYRKDGHAEPEEGRIVVTIPFDRVESHEVIVEVD